MKNQILIIVIIFCATWTAIKTEQVCGKRSKSLELIVSYGGRRTFKNEWPWTVAFVDRLDNSFF